MELDKRSTAGRRCQSMPDAYEEDRMGVTATEGPRTHRVSVPSSDSTKLLQPNEMRDSIRKMQTYAIPPERASKTARRYAKVQVAAPDLVELHKMHETKHKNRKSRGQPTDHALNRVWGKSGSWRIIPETPLSSEEPFSMRACNILPRGTEAELCSSWGLAVYNAKGEKSQGDKVIGQDSYSLARLPNKWEVFCIFDGHGHNGHWPANRAAKTMPYFLQDDACLAMLDTDQPEAALLYASSKVEEDIEEESMEQNIDVIFCGCTALCVLRNPKTSRLMVGTLGDTRVILFVPGSDVIYQTWDQKPDHPQEKERLESMGCEVRIEIDDDDGHVQHRVFLKGENYPGIAMTRSFGDCILKENGLIAEPVCVSWSVSEHPGALLFGASDGVWEFLSSEQVASIISEELSKGTSHQGALDEVVRQARIRWREEEDNYCDDITAVLVPVTGPFAPASIGGPSDSCCGGVKEMCTLL